MIYLLSDIHGDMHFPGLAEYLEKASDRDLLLILGDMELSFEESEKNRAFTEEFLKIRKNIAFLDGNHDNFAYLNSFPTEEWHGGTVNRLSEYIVHLKRGNIYELEGDRFFVFGGCKSSPKWKEMGLWFPGEEPQEEELALARDNLKVCGYQVDYILTHKYEQTPGRGTVSEKLRELTDFIDEKVRFRIWYAGHWHTEGRADEKHMFLYDRLRVLGEVTEE